jgi:hypothetical protein
MEGLPHISVWKLANSLFASVLLVALSACLSSDPTSAGPVTPQSTGGGNNQTNPNGNIGGSSDGGVIDGTGMGGGDGGVISQYKPALAVRATGCIMCHANIASSVITDFGNGDPYFFGDGAGLNAFSGSIYGNHAENWGTGRVYGSVIVPKANLNSAALGISQTTLASYLASIVAPPDSETAKPTITEAKTVYIGAPTESRIRALGGTFPAAHPKWHYFPSNAVGDVTGLTLRTNGYVENTGDVECEGDLVVDGVVFLNNLRLKTSNGCRIYATASVFIQGPVTYLGGSVNANLQITSSRAIVLGLGQGPLTINESFPERTNNSLQHRLQDFWTRGGYFTRASGTVQEKLNAIVNDSLTISDLVDAQLQPTGRQVAFERLLLNAPNIQSRYKGQFDGVIIGEVVLLSLNTFQFKYDDVFSQVPILPLLRESEYLSVIP